GPVIWTEIIQQTGDERGSAESHDVAGNAPGEFDRSIDILNADPVNEGGGSAIPKKDQGGGDNGGNGRNKHQKDRHGALLHERASRGNAVGGLEAFHEA